MAELYNHKVVEKKWQKVWDDEKAFAATNDFTKPKYYALVEFPYPSGQGLQGKVAFCDMPLHSSRFCKKIPFCAGVKKDVEYL